MKRFVLPVSAVLVAALVVMLMIQLGLVINTTPSLPMGIYRMNGQPVHLGCYVLFRLPGEKIQGRPYAKGRLIKKVVASAGDYVTISPFGVVVNGHSLVNSAPVDRDVYGQQLPRLQLDSYELQRGEVLTMSAYNPRSFDSRYFGVITSNNIIGVLEPVLTWGKYPE
jgi:conjugative transfer signal peptidase TraF